MRYLVLILITILIIPPCFAEVINVPDDFETIQGAINESEDGDTVLVDEGVYRENLNFWGIQILLASRFIFEEDTNLIEETVIDGNREGSVITMTNGEPEGTEIIGLTIRNGAGTRVDIDDEEWYFCGAGVFAIDASPTFRSCVITNNRIDDERSRASGVYIDGGSARFINCLTADNSPGGLSAKNASVELTGCRFIYDSAGINGGEDREIIVRNCLFSGNGLGLRSSDITVEDCVFRENDSGLSLGSTTGDVTGCSFIEIDGNALSLSNTTGDVIGCSFFQNNERALSGGDPDNTIEDCLFEDNTAWVGGVYNIDRVEGPLFKNCIFRNNQAAMGGVFRVAHRAILRVENCLFTGNSASEFGGVFTGRDGGRIDFINCTMYGNRAENEGGAIAAYGGMSPHLTNCILYDNGEHPIRLLGGAGWAHLFVEYSLIENGRDGIQIDDRGEVDWLEGNIDEDPLFVDPDEGDFHLTEDSPCIDTGDPDSPEDPDGTRADMGVFYFPQRDPDEDGVLNVPDEYATIQGAIHIALEGDTVLVAPGEYVENINFNGKAILVLGNSDDPSEVVIDGNAEGCVVTFDDAEERESELAGFTIRNGSSNNGGGIYCHDRTDVVLSDLVIEGNAAERFGGGIFGSRNSNITMTRCEVHENHSDFYGGGLSFEGDEITIEDCSFTHNTAQGDAAAMRLVGNSVSMSRVLVANNECGGYANVKITSIGAQLDRLTIIDNIAREGDAMGGILFRGDLSNSIVRGNSHGQVFLFGDERVSISYCDIENGEEGILDHDVEYDFENNIDEDPLFVDPDEGDFYLTADSPCIDTGDPDSPEDPDGTRADMGAFYFPQRDPDEDGILHVPDEYETIQEAIDTAEDGDSVLVAPGEYVENINFEGKAIVVIGNPDNPSEVIIDGDSSGTVVTFENEESLETVLIGFTIINGSAEFGGGIKISGASPQVKNCIIIENTAVNSGGGLRCSRNSSAKFVNLMINSNHAGNGGAGMDIAGSSPNLINCTFDSNTSGNFGAGLSNDLASPRIINSVFINNTAEGVGGGISNYTHSYPKIINCTFSRNSGSDGGGMWNGMSFPLVLNSIFWENSPDEIFRDSTVVNYSDIQGGWEGEGNINSDPFFVDAENGDFQLSENSPCIDAGIVFFVWEEDTLLNLSEDEYHSFAPDMGAYESEYENQVIEDADCNPEKYLLFPAYPNPFNSSLQIRYNLPKETNVEFILYNIAGRSVFSENTGLKTPGLHSFDLHAGNLPSGLYILQMNTDASCLTRKISLLK